MAERVSYYIFAGIMGLVVIAMIVAVGMAGQITKPESVEASQVPITEAESTPSPGQEPTPTSMPKTTIPSATLETKPEDTPVEPPLPSQEVQQRIIKEWSGNGIKTTEPFTIENKPWAITWAHEPKMIDGQSMGIFQIMVYRVSEPDFPITLAANSMERGADSSYIYETGQFFLTMNAANTNWKVQVIARQ